MKIFILFLAFNTGGIVPEGWPNKGIYYHDAAACAKAAEKYLKKGNVAAARCLSVELEYVQP